MPAYKLIYFNLRGRAEGIRWILAQAGVDYEDQRVERENWPSLKPTMPMGQVPVLEVDGKKLSQSVAIARYIARKHNLTGADELEAAQCDMIVDGAQDMLPKLRPVIMALMGGDNEKMKEEFNALKADALPTFFTTYEKFLADNGSGFYVGKELTWADIWVAELISRLSEIDASVIESYPNVKKHIAMIQELPAIKAWIEKRPKTSF